MAETLALSVSLHSVLGSANKVLELALAGALEETGEAIAAAARANMHPGYAYETGYMQSQTTYDPVTKQVQVNTDYAAYVELGTVKMQARPFLMPAILQMWPRRLEETLPPHLVFARVR